MTPHRRRRLLRIGAFVVTLSVLLLPWPGLGRAFAGAVGTVATAVADPVFASTNVTLLCRATRDTDRLPSWDAVLSVRQDAPDGPTDRAGAVDLRRAGYLQLATFLALAVAWPPEAPRRAWQAAAAAFAIVSLVVAMPLIAFLSQIGAVHLSVVSSALVSLFSRVVVGAPGMAYAVPALTWVASAHPLPSIVASGGPVVTGWAAIGDGAQGGPARLGIKGGAPTRAQAPRAKARGARPPARRR